MKKTLQELDELILKAKFDYGLFEDSMWRHYKGQLYRVLNLSIDCNTDDLLIFVNYTKESSNAEVTSTNVIFSRNILEWDNLIDGVPRFVKVNKYQVYMTREQINEHLTVYS